MTDPAEFDARLTAVENRVARLDADVAVAASDAAAARRLAAARDRDLADLTIKVDANRSAVNALGIQTAARFDRLEQRVETGFAEMRAKFELIDRGFVEMRAKFDRTAAGMEQIVELLTDREDRRPPDPGSGTAGS